MMNAHAAVVAWLLSAINAWGAAPLPQTEAAHAEEVRGRTADAIMAVAYDAEEPPVYQGHYGRARTALLLASIESLESRFLERILNGHCRPDECDSGHAVSGLQIHMGRYGIRLIGDKAAQCLVPMADCYRAAELVDDWVLAERIGIHIYRTNPSQYSTVLPALRQATAWVAKNAPPALDDDVLQEQLAER